MISRWRVVARSLVSIGVGGASGSLLDFLQSNANLAQVDYHKMAQSALLGAVTALLFHWKTPPNEPAKEKS